MKKISELLLAVNIVEQAERKGINLAAGFEEWTRVGMALSALGEPGRPLYHRLSALDSRYNRRETDRKFTQLLRSCRSVNISTLLYIAGQHGIMIKGAIKDHSLTDNYLENVKIGHFQPRQRNIIQQVDYLPIERLKTAQIGFNAFIDFLVYHFDLADVLKVANYYMLRTYRCACVFPQIDGLGRLRTGKVIPYKPDGHRDKSKGCNWLHALYMRKQGKEPADFHLKQCLFGEHLLAARPGATVALCESEKTAILGSLAFPNMLWVSVGGEMCLTAERVAPLQGRRVVIFPDADAVDVWKEKASEIPALRGALFSNWAANEPAGSKRDIGDVIIERIRQKITAEHGE